jgi:hypothetical protein
VELYRQGEVHGLEVAAMTVEGDTALGTLTDLTGEGAAVSFPRYADATLPVGSRSTLNIYRTVVANASASRGLCDIARR